ncbi:MAG: methyltransferase domain-containing protein [Candidatus Omnitrophota bacterium]
MNITNKEARLNRFYGDVARVQNRDIIGLITGRRILDIGCGYGNLMKQIKENRRDAQVTGIDSDPEAVKIAKDLYGINVGQVSVHDMDFPKDHFDTVLLRETIHHFDTEESMSSALKKIKEVCAKELIIFDPNPNFIVRLARKIIRHQDPEAQLDDVVDALEKNGFKVIKYSWRDIIALPLSGGYVGIELVPNAGFIKKMVITFDNWLNAVLRRVNMQRLFCWRYLIYAIKHDEKQKEGEGLP